MRLKDIMTTTVETIAHDAPAFLANEMMWRKQIHHLVVMNGQDIAGVISDTDLGGPEEQEIPDNLQVKDVMRSNVVTARPDTTVKDALNLMRGHRIHCLPVLDNRGVLAGIVTITDILTLEKRGTAHVPFQGTQPQDPYSPLYQREGRGSKSKHSHSEWPDRPPH